MSVFFVNKVYEGELQLQRVAPHLLKHFIEVKTKKIKVKFRPLKVNIDGIKSVRLYCSEGEKGVIYDCDGSLTTNEKIVIKNNDITLYLIPTKVIGWSHNKNGIVR